MNQCEYATDIVFQRQADLAAIYGHLTRTAIHTVKPDNIATFLGRKLNVQYKSELVPEAMKALHALWTAVEKGGLPKSTLGLVELRASQINGCSVCVDMHARQVKQAGESDERLFAVAACAHHVERETPPVHAVEEANALAGHDGSYVNLELIDKPALRYCRSRPLHRDSNALESSAARACSTALSIPALTK